MEAKKLIEENYDGEVEVNYQLLSSGAAINEGINGGNIDIGCMGAAPAISGVAAGIGVFIHNSRTTWIDYTAVYAALLLIILVGVTVEYGIFRIVEKKTVRKWGMVRCIAGFEEFEGSIVCNGKEVKKPSTERIMVFQDYNQLFPWKTVEQNIQYPLKVNGIRNKAVLKEKSEEAIKKVGLSGYQKYYPHELSGGMKQRVAIAKALALTPEIILMDEPFAALDAITRNHLQKELYDIYKESNMTVMFITHNIQEAITLGTRVLLMGKGGKIIMDEENKIEKPVKPSSPGYGAMWDKFSLALEQESKKKIQF